jgi:hypothetical protein
VSPQTIQVREMSRYGNYGDYDYYDSDGDGHNIGDYDDVDVDYDDYDDDTDDDDEEWIESESVSRRNIISDLHASCIQNLELSGELWASSVAMELFQPDLENLLVALQSNRSLQAIEISRDFLATIRESNQGRLFYGLGDLPTL